MSQILIVDDSQVEIKIIRSYLGDEYEIWEASNGEAALAIARGKKPDLILLDIVMPGMDGYTVCRQLKADPETAGIPVIFISVITDAKNIVKGFEAGGQDYITKPFYSPELCARIKVHIELKEAKETALRYARELEAKNEKLNEMLVKIEAAAMTDFLTGLANRWFMTKRIKKENDRIRSGRGKATLILSDIDDFKQINDNCGHDCGDRVLKDVAGLMSAVLRDEDIIARWGGEEFLLMLPECDVREGAFVAERIRKVIETAVFPYEDRQVAVTVTLGVAELDPELGFDQSIKNADEALYRGKHTVKNCVVVYQKK